MHEDLREREHRERDDRAFGASTPAITSPNDAAVSSTDSTKPTT
jgi:hypothetical protein